MEWCSRIVDEVVLDVNLTMSKIGVMSEENLGGGYSVVDQRLERKTWM